MALWNLSDKTILIVDDFPEMRSLLRSMVSAYGAEKIEMARNGEDAVELLGKQRFDIVLCDYNLGDGKDGQQVLEEAKYRNLLPCSTTFVIVTAETTAQMVMGALEYQPDGYISKPVTKTVLQVRLKKFLEKKDALRSINLAYDRKQFGKVLELCDQQLDSGSKYRFELLKLKSDLFIRTGAYDQALTLCESVLEERELPWALFDIGRVHFLRQQYPQAAEYFSRILKDNASFVSAYDWLARTQERLGNPEQAQGTLQAGIGKSPKSLLRQRALAEVSDKNADYEVTEAARRKAIRVGKGSVLRQPGDYSALAKVLVKNDTAKEALKVVGLIKHEFRDNPEAELEAAAAASNVYTALGNQTQSSEMLDRAMDLAANMPEIISHRVGMELAEACLQHDRKDEANEIVRTIIKNNHDDEDVLARIAGIYRETGASDEIEELIENTRKEIVHINNEGVKLLKEGKITESIELFSKAAQGMPQNPIINLNAAQSLIRLMKESGPDKSTLAETLQYIQAANNSELHRERQNKLIAVCRELSADLAR